MDDLISREATLEAFADYVAHGMSMNDYDALEDIVIHMPSVRICTDAISRTDAIRVASGYCHWSNIPAELAKLPSVNPIQCEDAISRQAVLDGLARIAKAKAKSDAQKAMMGRTMFFVEQLPSVSTEKTGHWEWVQYDSDPRIGNWHCSECRNILVLAVKKDDVDGIPIAKYCPNCGAKMEVEE